MSKITEKTPGGTAAEDVIGSPLRQTGRLANIGLLALSTTHDLNNFLTSILGHANLVREEIGDPARLEHHLAQIETGAERAVELIRLLRLCADDDQPAPQPLVLNRVVREMLDLLNAVISNRARLRVELAPDLPSVFADATQLRQVIMNLIVNASEALPAAEGTIRVRTGTADLTGHESTIVGPTRYVWPGHYAFVEVRDNGTGMDEKTRVRIFEPFFTTKPTGSGLGLEALRDFARCRHHAIELITAPGQGSTFRVLLRAPQNRLSSEIDEP